MTFKRLNNCFTVLCFKGIKVSFTNKGVFKFVFGTIDIYLLHVILNAVKDLVEVEHIVGKNQKSRRDLSLTLEDDTAGFSASH